MARSLFLTFLLIMAVLSVSFPQGYGRRVKVLRHSERGLSSEPLHEGISSTWQEGEMVMDYKDPGANINPKNGPILNSPTTPTSPPWH